MADQFTAEELQEVERRAHALSTAQETEAGMRAALQLLAEAAGNVASKLPPADEATAS